MASFSKVFAVFCLMAVLIETANAGAFARRSTTSGPVEPTAVERVVHVSILPQVPAFISEARSGAAKTDAVSRRSAPKSERAPGYSLEASLFALDIEKEKNN